MRGWAVKNLRTFRLEAVSFDLTQINLPVLREPGKYILVPVEITEVEEGE